MNERKELYEVESLVLINHDGHSSTHSSQKAERLSFPGFATTSTDRDTTDRAKRG